MKKLLLYVIILIIFGCSNFFIIENQLYLFIIFFILIFIECLKKLVICLDKIEIKFLFLIESLIKIFDSVNFEKYIGYKFYVRIGKDFYYRIISNVCIWIFVLDIKLL